MNKTGSYKPISDYGAIGNMRSVALIGRDGSLDWCCLPFLDKPSVFAAILDAKKGGRFSIEVAGDASGLQEYVQDSNVLRTRLMTEKGGLTITDFMPVDGDISTRGSSSAQPEIHRLIECEGDDIEIRVEWSPRFDYSRSLMQIKKANNGYLATDGKNKLSLSAIENASVRPGDSGPILEARFHMKGGERRCIITRWGSEHAGGNTDDSLARMKETAQIWYNWVHKEEAKHSEDWAGDLLSQVVRAELVFKMLTDADTGAVAAAPTTSLPEVIGGVRNWDYRYAWIRDASLTAQALIALGHSTEAIDLLNWIEDVSAVQYGDRWNLQVMYGLKGDPDLEEYELPHLEGYRASSPVRVGNGAAKQFQLETFGEIVSTGYELVRRGEKLRPEVVDMIRRVADHVTEVWEQPDYGIWEVRAGPQCFTYSKIMAWVALDRAIRIAGSYDLSGAAVAKWKKVRKTIREQVLAQGYNEDAGAFTLHYGSKELDAANLRIPLLEFLPVDDIRVQNTIDRTMDLLVDNGLVHRYLTDDGLPGKEGAFGLCTFWLVDVLALSGRMREAHDIFSRVLGCANHIGLLAEQFDPQTSEHLGNFPQAFTHIGLVNSVLYLAHAEGKAIPDNYAMGGLSQRTYARK